MQATGSGGPPLKNGYSANPPPASDSLREQFGDAAVTYVEQVKMEFGDRPESYNEFLTIMKHYHDNEMTILGVIERLSSLFHGCDKLLLGFTSFLPDGCKIELSDIEEMNRVHERKMAAVRDPSSQAPMGLKEGMPNAVSSSLGQRKHLASGPSRAAGLDHGEAGFGPPKLLHVHPPIPPGGEAIMPLGDSHGPSHTSGLMPMNIEGGPGGDNGVQGVPPVWQPEVLDHATSYVTAMKERFSQEPQNYKAFLEILRAYQKEQRGIKDVLEQISSLFSEHPDLVREFTYFLPDPVQDEASEILSSIQTKKKKEEENSAELEIQKVPKQVQEKHRTPATSTRVHVAASKGNFSKVKRCLAAGDEVDAVDESGWSPLIHAAKNGQLKVVNVLLKSGADTSFCTPQGFQPLYYAVQHDHTSVVKSLVKAGADIDAGNGATQETALMMAAGKGYVDTATVLIDAGADISKRSTKGATALSFAACKGSDDVLLMLIDAGADVDDTSYNGNSALVHAARGRHIDTVLKLIERGANVNLECTDGRTVLHHVSELGFDDMIVLLVRSGADVNHKVPTSGKTALDKACWKGHHTCARLLIELGADVTAATTRGFTSLHEAVSKTAPGRLEVIKLLLSAGANLLAAGGDTANDAQPPLFSAAGNGWTAAAGLLIEAGTDPNILDRNGRTALFYAKSLDVVKLLLAKGASAIVVDNFGCTVLYLAALRGSSRGVICALYHAGANPCTKTKKGLTASDIAREKGFEDTAILLGMLADK